MKRENKLLPKGNQIELVSCFLCVLLFCSCASNQSLIANNKFSAGMSKTDVCYQLVTTGGVFDWSHICGWSKKQEYFPGSKSELLSTATGSLHFVFEGVTEPMSKSGLRYGNGKLVSVFQTREAAVAALPELTNQRALEENVAAKSPNSESTQINKVSYDQREIVQSPEAPRSERNQSTHQLVRHRSLAENSSNVSAKWIEENCSKPPSGYIFSTFTGRCDAPRGIVYSCAYDSKGWFKGGVDRRNFRPWCGMIRNSDLSWFMVIDGVVLEQLDGSRANSNAYAPSANFGDLKALRLRKAAPNVKAAPNAVARRALSTAYNYERRPPQTKPAKQGTTDAVRELQRKIEILERQIQRQAEIDRDQREYERQERVWNAILGLAFDYKERKDRKVIRNNQRELANQLARTRSQLAALRAQSTMKSLQKLYQ